MRPDEGSLVSPAGTAPALFQPCGNKASWRAGLFYDGMTLKILGDYYRHEHWRQSRPSFRGLDRLAGRHLQEVLQGPVRVTQRHLFIGAIPSTRSAQGEAALPLAFQHVMRHCGVVAHCLPLRARQEKGIDTLLTMELLEKAMNREIDVAVLLATDGDFAPLLRRVRSMGVPVLLLGFHLPSGPRQPVCLSTRLTDEATWNLDVSGLIESPHPNARSLADDLFRSR